MSWPYCKCRFILHLNNQRHLNFITCVKIVIPVFELNGENKTGDKITMGGNFYKQNTAFWKQYTLYK